MKMIDDVKDSKFVKSQKGRARMKLCDFIILLKSGKNFTLTSTSHGCKIEATLKKGDLKRLRVRL